MSYQQMHQMDSESEGNIHVEIGTNFKCIDGLSKKYNDEVVSGSLDLQIFLKEKIVKPYQSYCHNGNYFGLPWNIVREEVVKKGKADFDAILKIGDIEISSYNKCLAYCYSNMRIHLYTYKQIFLFFQVDVETEYFFRKWIMENKFTMIDVGCGPITSALAICDLTYEKYKSNTLFDYIGVDLSIGMLEMGRTLSNFQIFDKECSFRLIENLRHIDYTNIAEGLIIVNFSFFFFNVGSKEEVVTELTNLVLNIEEYNHKNPILIVYQNPNFYCESYEVFKASLDSFNTVCEGSNKLKYSNKMFGSAKNTEFSFEILGNAEGFARLGLYESFNSTI